MVYDFAAKIRHIKNTALLEEEQFQAALADIHDKFDKTMPIKILITDAVAKNVILVKSECSVSSMPGFVEIELNEAIETFKGYMTEIARALEGVISENEGFYNNSKTFSKLYT